MIYFHYGEFAPTFELNDNGTDASAYTNELFTIRKTLSRTDNIDIDFTYTLVFDWGVLGTETFTGNLGMNESVNIQSAKILADIEGSFEIEITGTVEELIEITPKDRDTPLYNWYAATDVRNIAITGWHVPTRTEYETLETLIGGQAKGGDLKKTGFLYWNSPNVGATNLYGFDGKGNGRRTTFGNFDLKNNTLHLWTTTQADTSNAHLFNLFYDFNTFIRNEYPKKLGGSIRLIKDNNTPSVGAITDIDGNVYTEVVIGTQIWLKEDLRVTKYRNGDAIPNITDNTAWSNLTTGAFSYYI
jgi:uncharacterized protein (TIGR02145 family)